MTIQILIFIVFLKNEERYVKEVHICYEMTKSKV